MTERDVVVYLVNALWMAPVVGGVAWAVAWMARAVSARWEHRVWVGALAAQVVVPLGSVDAVRWELSRMSASAWGWLMAVRGVAAHEGTVRVVMGPGLAAGGVGLAMSEPLIMGLVLAYAGCVVYFAARLVWGLWQCGRHGELDEPDEGVRREFERQCRLAGVRGARIAISAAIGGPQTMGIGRPLLLLPAGFVERVSEAELAMVLAHEAAHMRRWDFAKNLAYAVGSLPLCFHPAMWVVRGRIAASREMVCDALAAGEERESYARSLLRLAAMVAPVRENIHAIGIFDANGFERRVMRLITGTKEVSGMRRWLIAAGCAVLVLATGASAVALRVGVGEEKSAEKTVKRVAVAEKHMTLVAKKDPVYPPDAKRAKIQGGVVLKVVVGKDGVVEQIAVKSGPKELQQSALDAVKDWKWQPYLLNGDPVEVETEITVVYSLAG